METLKNLYQILIDYVLNNQLFIDKSTFFTIVIGQITIYGILLTFYQFVASYQGNEKDIKIYLKTNIMDFYVKKNMSIFNNIISKKLFGVGFILEILYKPFITIYGYLYSASMINVMNFVWYVFVVFYFVIFVILFFQCTKSLLRIKLNSDAKTNGRLIQEINRKFLKKTVKERISQTAIALLNEDFIYLKQAIEYDDNSDLQIRYNELVYNILDIYTKQKENEISRIERTRKISKNQKAWIYNANCEIGLLLEILDGKYFPLDEKNLKYIFIFHKKLLQLNLKRAELEGFEKVNCNKYKGLFENIEEKVFDASEWEDATIKIYKIMNDKMKKDAVYSIQSDVYSNQILYENYCYECILTLIETEIENVFKGKRQQKDFIKIFALVIKEERVNNFYSEIIKYKLISYNRYDARDLISLLSEKNCTYLFSYIIIHYSIYRFRSDWEYININILKFLWDHHSNMKDVAKDVIQRIKKSNIGHRFSPENYMKFMEYIEAHFDGKLLSKVKNDNMLDVFFIFVIKMCVINQETLLYSIYKDEIDSDIQITIINELSKHDELMVCNDIQAWIYRARYNYFTKLDSIPEKLNISLRNLLLTDLNSMAVINYVSENYYLYRNCIGAYLLIKMQELSIRTQKEVRETVKAAFISSNMKVDEYVNMLEKECRICKHEINYIQKENMKRYLLKITKERVHIR